MKIAERYLKSEFIFDFIPLIPFPLILKLSNGREYHFYIIKCVRVITGFKIFDSKKIMLELRKYYRRRLENVIRNDPLLAENRLLN